MELVINGECQEHEDGLSVADLLETLDKPAQLVAVEVNRDLVPRARHAETTLSDGDNVEIVSLVGGG
jgi:sulfur carrier protein